MLDKRRVFSDRCTAHGHEWRKVPLDGAFNGVTRLVFRLFEVGFWMGWRTDFTKDAGAVLGLAIGYTAKYVLDQTFVFKERSA